MLNKELMNKMQGHLITHNIKVFLTLGGVRRIGEVIGVNPKTTWVRVMTGARKYIVIKRHNKKHNLNLYKTEAIITEPVEVQDEHVI